MAPGASSFRWSLAVVPPLLVLLCGAGLPPAKGLVASRGNAATLDVANWNLEWFGDTTNGPSNEVLQQANALAALRATDFDVWALEEVVSAAAFTQLKAQLAGYAGVLSSDATVTGGAAAYARDEQKVALLWKTSIASLVSAKILFASKAFDFGGRPPLEVKLNVTLNGVTEPRVFIVLHMKAFNDVPSWQRRAAAATALKGYLDATYPTQKVIVLGDWNDDLDTSITAGKPTPFQSFLSASASYTFPTRAFTTGGTSTTCSHAEAIDHQLVTNELAADVVPGSVESYRLSTQLSGYCSNTTDHFPTLVRYRFGGGGASPGRVLLNEVLANEPGSSPAGEFVELVNVGGAPVSLAGWTLQDKANLRHTFAAGTTLAAGKAIVVFGAAAGIPAGAVGAIAASTGGLGLNNDSDTVSVRDGAGATVDSLTYDSALAGTDGVSMNRGPDATAGAGFVLHTALGGASSPGKKASGAAF